MTVRSTVDRACEWRPAWWPGLWDSPGELAVAAVFLGAGLLVFVAVIVGVVWTGCSEPEFSACTPTTTRAP